MTSASTGRHAVARFSLIVAVALSVGGAGYHALAHDAMLPTLLEQYSLLAAAGLFAAASYVLSRRPETVGGRTAVCAHAVGLFVATGVATALYVTYQYLAPTVDIGLEAVAFEALFLATVGGTVGLYVGREVARSREIADDLRHEQTLTETVDAVLPDPLYAFDENGRFLRWNDQMEAVSGYDAAEIAEMGPSEFIAPADRDDVGRAIERVLEDDETVTVRARFETKAGETVPYEFTGARFEDERRGVAGVVGIGRDVSERLKRQRRYEAILDNAYQFTGLLDPDGTVLEANETALSFGGIDREDAVGEQLHDTDWFQVNEDTRTAAREAVERAREGSFVRDQLRLQGSGRETVVDFSVRPVRDGTGAVSLLVVEGRDITELTRREEQLSVLHRFLRHDMRNHLNVVEGYAEHLLSDLDDPEALTSARQIHESAGELHRSAELVRDLSKSVTGQDADTSAVGVEAVVDAAVSSTEAPASVVDIAFPDGDVRVAADTRLERVFEELVDTLFEYGGDGVCIDITATGAGEYVSIVVEGTAVDIPEIELSALDGSSARSETHHPTGLGLELVDLIVDSYGGTVSYETPSDEDVRIVIEAPRAESPEEPV